VPQSALVKHSLVVHVWSVQYGELGHCDAVVHSPQRSVPFGSLTDVPQWGVEPLHCASVTHVSQTPPRHFCPRLPQSVSARHTQVPVESQCPVAHSASAVHSTHVFFAGSQSGRPNSAPAALQSASLRQTTHVSVAVSQKR
jgi:hypothetical protein